MAVHPSHPGVEVRPGDVPTALVAMSSLCASPTPAEASADGPSTRSMTPSTTRPSFGARSGGTPKRFARRRRGAASSAITSAKGGSPRATCRAACRRRDILEFFFQIHDPTTMDRGVGLSRRDVHHPRGAERRPRAEHETRLLIVGATVTLNAAGAKAAWSAEGGRPPGRRSDRPPRPRQRGARPRGGGSCRAMHTNLVCAISSIPNRPSRRPVRRRAVRHVHEDEISPAHAAGPAAGTVRRTVPRPITSTASPGAQAAMSWASSRRRRRRTASAGRPRIAGIASSNPR